MKRILVITFVAVLAGGLAWIFLRSPKGAAADAASAVSDLRQWVADLLPETLQPGELNLRLLKAASAGDAVGAKKLIARGADVNYQHGPDKITPLMIAAMRGRKTAFELLLNSGADPKLTDKDGATAGDYLVLVGKGLPDQDLKAMAEMLRAKGGTIKNMDALARLLFVGTKPLSPQCYDFEKPPCGVPVK